MAQISFFPYIFLPPSMVIQFDGILVWNFDSEKENKIPDESLRLYVEKLLDANQILGKPINGIGIITFGESQTIDPLSQVEKYKIEELRKVLFLCAVAKKNVIEGPNSGHQMVTAENFVVITQNFVPDHKYTSYQAGVIVTSLNGGYKVGEIKYEAPRDLLQHTLSLDTKLFDQIKKLKKINSSFYKRLLLATDAILDSYYNSTVVSNHSRILLQVRAFEILFKLPKRNQRMHFKKAIARYCQLETEKRICYKSERPNGRFKNEEGSCHEAWADDLYSLRNKIIHGDQIENEALYFFKQIHFRLSLWFFLVSVKQLVNECFDEQIFDDAIRWHFDCFVYEKFPSERRMDRLRSELEKKGLLERVSNPSSSSLSD